jgi:sortase A
VHSTIGPRGDFLLDRAVNRRRSRGIATAERLLWTFGLLLVSFYGVARLYSQFSQAYYNWALDRTIQGKSVLVRDFVADLIHSSRTAPVARPSVEPAPTPTGAERPPVRLERGAPIGRLDIPRLQLSVMVLEGTDQWTLNQGAGHIEGTSMPGIGNFAVAAHRDSFFRSLKDISGNDTIVITTAGGSYRYRVEDTRIVEPADTAVLHASASPTLTLVTCYPFYYLGHAPKRFVVRATLDGGGG